MNELGESSKQNKPERYTIPPEIQQWVDDYTARQDKDDLSIEELRANQKEFDELAKENPEYQLALLRRANPDSGDVYRLETDLIYDKEIRQEKIDIEQAEKTPVNPENNILTHYEDTLERMTQCEHPGWKDWQGNDHNNHGLKKALEDIKRYNGRRPDINYFIVHGGGGWNRWVVRSDGSVEFSAGHSTKEKTTIKAKLLGFKIN